ncbi:DUF2304 domain-containing protein [Lancefieldella parvula]|uniref:DUF2304 domain-containing protein n=2 Tax=Lancefieldella parvula TaxID=1382 RepID=C8W7I7_LANP1|nr:DUF2304 domain-containing protein [Lancefieldella parvula]ACV51427.1 hypothetical protein Apar_0998 [Lancefieldella parvula DSM 20469]
MTLVLRILLLIGALFAMGIVINSVRKSKIRISDSVYWVVSAVILVLFALIPQLAYFFSGLFGFMSPANFVLLLVIVMILIRLFHQSCAISKLTYKVEQLSSELALRDKDTRDEKSLDFITDLNQHTRV